MDGLSRPEYPAMLASLQPGLASQTLVDRVKRISRINNEIADWLQERRRIEEQYVQGLRKLTQFKVPNASSELGVFQGPWDKVLHSVDSIAASHALYASRIEKDVEQPLRNYHHRKEVAGMQTFMANMQGMARELEDSQHAAEKQSKKGGKKAEVANARFENATQQWDSQAPFIYESLQALDEQRTNHLRDVLTQLQTHEVDQASRTQASAEEALNMTLEISTEQEIQAFAARMTAGKAKIEKRAAPPTRQSTSSAIRPPSSAGGLSGHANDEMNASEHFEPPRQEPPQPESKLRRLGTMLGRRRQSIHGGFGQLSPSKNSGPFSRGLSSSHGRSVSPRASSHNLAESSRLSSLVESPDSPRAVGPPDSTGQPSHEGTNGVAKPESADAAATSPGTADKPSLPNGERTADDIFGPAPGSAASEKPATEAPKDAEGFTVPPEMNDPISQAQKEAAATEENDQFFRLNIQKEPVAEEDADAQKAAISNVTNTLSLSMPSRKSGTVRGRRDVRNTIYMPVAHGDMGSAGHLAAIPPSPSLPASLSNASLSKTVATLTSEASIAAASDTQSVRSATSLGGLVHVKHPEMTAPGLNSSVIETVSATFEGAELKSVKVNGEIAFSYNEGPDFVSKGKSSPLDVCGSASATYLTHQTERETVRIDNFPLLEVIGPNRIFVSNTGHSDEFALDTSHISKTSTAFTYRLHSDPTDSQSLASHCPLIIKSVWKPAPDHKLGLLLQYRLNSALFPGSEETPQSLTLHNLYFVATYEGRASGAQSKPTCTHLRDKHLVYWRLGDVTLKTAAENDPAAWSKIVCRVVGAEDSDIQSGHIEARWEYTPPAGTAAARVAVSRLLDDTKGKGKATDDGESDPFSDDNPMSPRNDDRTWEAVPVVRKVVSGRYEVKGGLGA